MSSLKATLWRPAAAALAVLVLAVLALSVSGAGTARAGGAGAVSLDPSPLEIGVGGQGTVSVMIDPPASGVSIWIIQFTYDPAVAEVVLDGSSNPMCTNMATIPGSGIAQASGCDVKDTNTDTKPDTAVTFGGFVQNDNGTPKGFITTQTAATFTFKAIGAVGAHTDLNVTVSSMLGPNGEVGAPTTSNGAIDIVAAQGLTVAWGNGDCSPTLTSAPGPVDALKILFTDAGTPPTQTVTGCPAYGANVTVNGLTVAWGNFDCTAGGTPGPLDALKLLFVDAGSPPAQTVANCPAYSAQVTITT